MYVRHTLCLRSYSGYLDNYVIANKLALSDS